MSTEAWAEAERTAFESHEAPSWEADAKARDAAIRWHLRGFNAGAEWQASLPVTDAEVEVATEALWLAGTGCAPTVRAALEAARKAVSGREDER